MNDERNHRQRRRYMVEMPIEVEGTAGHTIDVSASGVLFELNRLFAPGTPITFEISMGDARNGPMSLQCEGHVVRIAEGRSHFRVAAMIDAITSVSDPTGGKDVWH